MKKLVNMVNVDPITAEWPYGEVKDDVGANQGTEVEKNSMSDIWQLMARMANELVAIDPTFIINDVLDNEYDGFQLYEAFRKLTKPYEVYTAKHAQVGGGDPTTTFVGVNGIGLIVWTRTGAGIYSGTLVGKFLDAKTVLFGTPGRPEVDTGGKIVRLSDDVIEVRTYSGGSLSDSISDFFIEIRVYD